MLNEAILLALPHRPEHEMERVFAEKAIRGNPHEVLDKVLAFEKCVYVFNNLKPDFTTFEPLGTLCNARAVKEILGIVPDWKFHREIRHYLAYIAWQEGWVRMPDILSFAQRELDDITPGSTWNIGLDDEQQKLQALKHAAVKKYLETDLNES